MIYRCKGCGGVLEYSIELAKMECVHCGNTYTIEEISSSQKKEEEGEYVSEREVKNARKRATIPMQIIRCTSCGAELAINGVEVSSYCTYCGQATVVKDRVQDVLIPDFIIPFRKTRDFAKCVIQETLSNAPFVPKGLKHFEVDKIRGIYVPFWLFDVDCYGRQYYSFYKNSGKYTVKRYEYFEGKTVFHQMTVDASKTLNDDVSARLEPYDLSRLEKFNDAYLAGFYADRFDVGTDDSALSAENKAIELFCAEASKQLWSKNPYLENGKYDVNVLDTQYALLPVWFLTFRYENDSYTMLVNGQTGKVVGSVPFDKLKVLRTFIGLSVLFGSISAFLCYWVLRAFCFVGMPLFAVAFLFCVAFFAIIRIAVGVEGYKKLKENVEFTTSSEMNRYVKERKGK